MFYTYESQNNVLKENINPVIVDVLKKDGETKPPNTSGKRQAGRPKKKDFAKDLNLLTQQKNQQCVVAFVKNVVIML